MEKLTLDILKQNFDEWVKEMNSKVCDMQDMPENVIENTGNIQHNYELASELRNEVEDLKQEIKLLKLMHLVNLKERKELKH